MFREEHLQQFWYLHAVEFAGLVTVCGQPVSIIDVGILNHDEGPDFINARIKIGKIEWAGNIEMHIRTSDWIRHSHHHDENYRYIILHVVWINDEENFIYSPLLELSKFFRNEDLVGQIALASNYQIQCSYKGIIDIDVTSNREFYALALNRFIRRKNHVLTLFTVQKFDFATVLWRLIFRSFGRSTNADAFEQLLLSIPTHLMRLYAYDENLIAALLMGQSNLLRSNFSDIYPKELYKNYELLKQRHGLIPIKAKMKFLRMRPRNFPTIRLAQLSAFFHQNMSLFKEILAIEETKHLNRIFNVNHHPYWNTHYLFDKESVNQPKGIGCTLRNQIILNALVPFVLAYGEIQQSQAYSRIALNWLVSMKPEEDAIVHSFKALGFIVHSSLDTQSLHELFNSKCIRRDCQNCLRGRSNL